MATARIKQVCLFIIAVLMLSVKAMGVQSTKDIRESAEIGPKGGSIMAEDTETGISVELYIPEGAINEPTTLTLVIHGTSLSKVPGKSHINGVSVLPESLYLLEKARIEVYNPPVEVNKSTILYRLAGQQFIIPLGNQVPHVDENYIEGTFYITGKFSIGTPTLAEVKEQSSKLAAYNPAQPLSYNAGDDSFLRLQANHTLYEYPGYRGPFNEDAGESMTAISCSSVIDEECLRWQKVLTKIEAIMTWVEFHQRNGNTSAENAEKRNAENALQEAIDDYFNKPSPSNRCGNYIKAAAKYYESAILLGMDIGGNSRIAKHFNQLVDECSFVFSVETHEWINHPKETLADGAWSEEKSNVYTTIKCYVPWKEFLITGTQKVRGEGVSSINYENHWVGDEKEDHQSIKGTWNVEKIEGAVQQYVDDRGEQTMLANISIYWKKNVATRIWGKNPQGTFDESGTDTRSFMEHKSYPLENGYSERIGNESAGLSLKVFILKAPGDERDNPNDCF